MIQENKFYVLAFTTVRRKYNGYRQIIYFECPVEISILGILNNKNVSCKVSVCVYAYL